MLDHFWDRFLDRFVEFGVLIVRFGCVFPLESTEDSGNSDCMSYDMPLKLPRYVFRRANGSFRYKRNVPLRLLVLLGKDTLYRQLGDSYREAMQSLPQVHAQVEAIF